MLKGEKFIPIAKALRGDFGKPGHPLKVEQDVEGREVYPDRGASGGDIGKPGLPDPTKEERVILSRK